MDINAIIRNNDLREKFKEELKKTTSVTLNKMVVQAAREKSNSKGITLKAYLEKLICNDQ